MHCAFKQKQQGLCAHSPSAQLCARTVASSSQYCHIRGVYFWLENEKQVSSRTASACNFENASACRGGRGVHEEKKGSRPLDELRSRHQHDSLTSGLSLKLKAACIGLWSLLVICPNQSVGGGGGGEAGVC